VKPLKGNRLKLAVRARQSACGPEGVRRYQRKRAVVRTEGAAGALVWFAGQHQFAGRETAAGKVATLGWCYSPAVDGAWWTEEGRGVPVGCLAAACVCNGCWTTCSAVPFADAWLWLGQTLH